MHRLRPLATILVCALALAACGNDDTGATAPATTTTTSEQQLSLSDVPFTFRYPGDFRAVAAERLPKGFRAILGLDPINFIDVRLTAGKALTSAQIRARLRKGLETSAGEIVQQGTVQRGGRSLVRFVVDAEANGTPTRSRLNFFRAGGRTWEIGCQSDAGGRARIDAACDRALQTLATR